MSIKTKTSVILNISEYAGRYIADAGLRKKQLKKCSYCLSDLALVKYLLASLQYSN